jgi:hypothetical protein
MNNKFNLRQIEQAKNYNYNNVTNFMDNNIGEFCPIDFFDSDNNNTPNNKSQIISDPINFRTNINMNSRTNNNNNKRKVDEYDIRGDINENTRLNDDFYNMESFNDQDTKYKLNNIQDNTIIDIDTKDIDDEDKDHLNQQINERFNQSSNLSHYNRFNRDNYQCTNGVCRPIPSKKNNNKSITVSSIPNTQKQFNRIIEHPYKKHQDIYSMNNIGNPQNNKYTYDIQGRIKKI